MAVPLGPSTTFYACEFFFQTKTYCVTDGNHAVFDVCVVVHVDFDCGRVGQEAVIAVVLRVHKGQREEEEKSLHLLISCLGV